MSRRGKDRSFHPHPGDPWHPGWSSEEVEEGEPEPEGVVPSAPALPERAAAGRPAPPPFLPPTEEPKPAVMPPRREGDRVHVPQPPPRDPVPPPWAPGEEAEPGRPEQRGLPLWQAEGPLWYAEERPSEAGQAGPETEPEPAVFEPEPGPVVSEPEPVGSPAGAESEQEPAVLEPESVGPRAGAEPEPEPAPPVVEPEPEPEPGVFEPEPVEPRAGAEPEPEPEPAPPAFEPEPEPGVFEPEPVEPRAGAEPEPEPAPPVFEPEPVGPLAEAEPEPETKPAILESVAQTESLIEQGPLTEEWPVVEAAAQDAGPVPPPWEPEVEEGEDLEVAEWLTFAEGSAAPAPAADAGEEPAAPRRRWWAFGRRHPEAPAPAATTQETGRPEPPPWVPTGGGEGPQAGGPAEEPEPERAAEEADEGEAAWEEWAAGEPEDQPPAWMAQSELDRPAAIPLIPVEPEQGEDRVGESEPEEAEEEAGDEWASWAPPAEGERAGRRAGVEAGAGQTAEETVEVAAAETPAAPWGPISEEMFVGAVTTEHRNLAQEVAAADTSEAQLQALSAPMAGLESGVVGFEDVVGPGEEIEPPAPRSDLPLRVVTGMVLVAILLGAMWVGGEVLAGFIGLLAMLGLAELYGALRRRGHQPLALFGYLAGAGLLAATWFSGLVAILIATVGLTVACFFYYTFASRRRDPLTNGGLTVLGVLWVPATVAFAFPIAAAPHFRVLVLAVAVTVIANDVGAFFSGRSWGSRPLAPVLSPNKTVEGLAGGIVLAVAAAVAMGYFFEPLNIRTGAALGLVVAVLAPLGDLAESMVKRSLGLKDMGSILPGHGGILDRIDAYLFVLPAAWVLFETLGLLR